MRLGEDFAVSHAAERANREMVDRLIAQEALWSPRLIEAFRRTPRHCFLDRVYQHDSNGAWVETDVSALGAEELALIYSDRALTTRLSPGDSEAAAPAMAISSSSQPSLMAQMLEDLRVRDGLRILEVGAGTGYNAALLAFVVGSAPGVLSLDVDRVVLAEAERHLQAFPERGVRLRHGDGRLGCPEEAPFDRLLVTAATPDLEPAWLEQLAPDGLLLAPLVLGPGLSFLVRGTVQEGVFHGHLTRPAYFMPLRAESLASADSADSADDLAEGSTGGSTGGEAEGGGRANLADPGSLHSVLAPWADWLGSSRGQLSTRSFLQALAFYGLLRGLSVSFQTYGDTTLYGVSDLVRGCTCWLGQHRWYVSGTVGRRMGEALWRAFLEAGAPSPTEFDLQAAPVAAARGSLAVSGRETYSRRGPLCRRVWQLREPRERPWGGG
jgi:protein-L-isoaspartate(D-aspartate) O-methyltransferase